MNALILSVAVVLGVSALQAQTPKHDVDDSTSVRGGVSFTANDSTTSRIEHKEYTKKPGIALVLGRMTGGFRLTYIADDSRGCISFHSVRHRVQRDTVVVTAFIDSLQVCPKPYMPRTFVLTVTGLRHGMYHVRIFVEDASGRGGERSGAPAWRSVSLLVQ